MYDYVLVILSVYNIKIRKCFLWTSGAWTFPSSSHVIQTLAKTKEMLLHIWSVGINLPMVNDLFPLARTSFKHWLRQKKYFLHIWTAGINLPTVNELFPPARMSFKHWLRQKKYFLHIWSQGINLRMVSHATLHPNVMTWRLEKKSREQLTIPPKHKEKQANSVMYSGGHYLWSVYRPEQL